MQRGPVGSSRCEVNLVALRCCDRYEVVVVGLVDHRLLVRYALRDSKHADEALTLMVPLPEVESEPMAAMDLSEDAEYLAVMSEDASLIIVPLLDLLCRWESSWAESITLHRASRVRPRFLFRERGALEMLADLFGGTTPAEPVESSGLRFTISALHEDGSSVTSVVWWTREPAECAGLAHDISDDSGSTMAASQEYYLLIGSLSGRLTIVDVVRQKEVRSFNLAPIVWLQRCQSRVQEWLLIETTSEPKHWKLLLATTTDQSGSSPLRWSIVDGSALPASASENFELEPLCGLPPLYQLLVLRRGRGEDRSGADTSVGAVAGDASSAVVETEVLGMLVKDEMVPMPPDALTPPLCLLLVVPSIPEAPLARIDLPITAAPPGAPGRRRLADVILVLGGGLVLSIVHIVGEHKAGDGATGDQTHLILSTAKPRPCVVGELDVGTDSEPPNSVIQAFYVSGRVLGGMPGYRTWRDSLGTEHAAVEADLDIFCGGSVWTTLAAVWTLNQVYVLKTSGAHLAVTLQTHSLLASAAALAPQVPSPLTRNPGLIPALAPTLRPEASPGSNSGPRSDGVEAAVADAGPFPLPSGPSMADLFESVLPILCWAFDIDFDTLMLNAGKQAFTSGYFEAGEKAVRTALSLWARRLVKVVPLLVLMECFGQLAQNVEVVRLTAPAILQVLMPHWPRIATEMEAVGSEIVDGARGTLVNRSGDPEGSAGARPRSGVVGLSPRSRIELADSITPGSPSSPSESSTAAAVVGPAAVAWFLSLAVMLLVIMHPKIAAARATGEYTRCGKDGAPRPAGARFDACEWQAWVSERVALMLSGSCGRPPRSFALFADQVQRDFESWWIREGPALIELKVRANVEGAPAIAAESSPLVEVAEPEMARPDGEAAVPRLGSTLSPLEPNMPIGSDSPSLPYEGSWGDCWCARLLLLSLLWRRWLSGDENGGVSSGCCTTIDLCGLAAWLVMRKEDEQANLVVVGTILSVLLRGLTLSHRSVAEDGCIEKPVWHATTVRLDAGLRVALYVLGAPLAGCEPGAAATLAWRVLWTTLRALAAPVCNVDGVGSQHNGAISVSLHATPDLDESFHGQPSVPTGVSDVDACVLGGSEEGNTGLSLVESKLSMAVDPLPWRQCSLSGGTLEAQSGDELLRRILDEGRDVDFRCGNGSCTTFAEEECAIFNLLGQLPDYDLCLECRTRWCWEGHCGRSATLCCEEPCTAQCPSEDRCAALQAVEIWLLEHAPVPLAASVENACDPESLTTMDAADEGRLEVQPDSRLLVEVGCTCNDSDAANLVRQGALAEDAYCDAGAAAGERLCRTDWWPEACARLPGALPGLVLARMAAEHNWIWELPWRPAFRLYLSHALFAMRSEMWPT